MGLCLIGVCLSVCLCLSLCLSVYLSVSLCVSLLLGAYLSKTEGSAFVNRYQASIYRSDLWILEGRKKAVITSRVDDDDVVVRYEAYGNDTV